MTTHDTNVDISVRVNGNSVAEYNNHEGKTFVEGKEGTEWSLHLKNRNPHRVMVAISLDGVNIISGKPADGTKDEAAYILAANESQTIKGYRLDDDNVAAFTFTKAGGSYAVADKGMTGTTGVIGVKVWAEKEQPKPKPEVIIKEVHHHHDHWHDYFKPYKPVSPYWGDTPVWCKGTAIGGPGRTDDASFSCSSNPVAQAGGASMGSILRSMSLAKEATLVPSDSNPFELGSTFGKKTESKVTTIAFEAGRLLGELTLYYTTRDGLKALGVDLSRTQKVTFPKAFDSRYAAPPSGWRG